MTNWKKVRRCVKCLSPQMQALGDENALFLTPRTTKLLHTSLQHVISVGNMVAEVIMMNMLQMLLCREQWTRLWSARGSHYY